MIYLNRISYRKVGLKYSLSHFEKPVSYVKSGERLVIEVEDACSGQIRKKGDFRDRVKIPFGNPVVGQIYVDDAETGHTLRIDIEEINPIIAQGFTYFSEFNEGCIVSPPIFKLMQVKLPCEPKICKIENGKVHFSSDIIIPYKPMIGTIGVSPFVESESISTGVLPGRHGGNMDLPDITIGSQVFLPVFHERGLLYLGDVHAVQGDGEISGTAVEMPA